MEDNKYQEYTELKLKKTVSGRSLIYRNLFGRDDDEGGNALGTLNGVVVPCLLNIVGVILFLRLSWSVGQAGAGGTFLIFLIAETQAILTVLSLAAIVTNGNVKGGGSYYMISRSLGPEMGGSIGLLFYLAYAMGACFYVVGFATEVRDTWFPDDTSHLFLTGIGSAVLFVILIISLLGAEYFTKVNIPIFFIQYGSTLFAIASFLFQRSPLTLSTYGTYVGPSWTTFKENWNWDYSVSEQCGGVMCDFRLVFAIIFPAATGIMEGANLSGDLKNPKKSIGSGTLIAVGIAIVTYIVLIICEAASFKRDTLQNNLTLIQETSFVPEVIIVGVLISSGSSALGSIFGGSRVLQALARDELFPYTKWLGVGSEDADEPRRAVLVTWAIAQGCLFIGGLDSIAPIISSFFCLSYAITNFSALLLRISGTPNFRPEFRYFNAYTALAGGLLNIIVMFWLNVTYAVVALLFLLSIYVFLAHRNLNVAWGDVSQALIFHQVRKYLLRLDDRSRHGKLWRPSILFFIGDFDSPLVEVCNRLKKGGLYIIGGTVVGESARTTKLALRLRQVWSDRMEESHCKAFVQVSTGPNARAGYQNLMLMSGLGGMTCNTVVLPLFDSTKPLRNEDDEKSYKTYSDMVEHMENNKNLGEHKYNYFHSGLNNAAEYVGILQDVMNAEKNLVIAANFYKYEEYVQASTSFVDVWLTEPGCTYSWEQFCESSLMPLQLAYVMTQNRFKDSEVFPLIRVFRVVQEDEFEADERSRLNMLLEETRIPASEVHIYATNSKGPPGNNIQQLNKMIQHHSGDAQMVFLAMPYSLPIEISPKIERINKFIKDATEIASNLPPVFLVASGDDSDLMSREV